MRPLKRRIIGRCEEVWWRAATVLDGPIGWRIKRRSSIRNVIIFQRYFRIHRIRYTRVRSNHYQRKKSEFGIRDFLGTLSEIKNRVKFSKIRIMSQNVTENVIHAWNKVLNTEKNYIIIKPDRYANIRECDSFILSGLFQCTTCKNVWFNDIRTV